MTAQWRSAHSFPLHGAVITMRLTQKHRFGILGGVKRQVPVPPAAKAYKTPFMEKFRNIASRLIPGSIILLAVILYTIPGSDPENEKMMRVGALVVFTLGFWATAALPEYMTALIFLLVAAASKLASPSIIFSGFHSGAIWLVLGGLIIGLVIGKVRFGRSS